MSHRTPPFAALLLVHDIIAQHAGAMNSMQAGLVPELAEHGIRINSVSTANNNHDVLGQSYFGSSI